MPIDELASKRSYYYIYANSIRIFHCDRPQYRKLGIWTIEPHVSEVAVNGSKLMGTTNGVTIHQDLAGNRPSITQKLN